MKPKLMFITAVLLFCSGYGKASDPPQTRPMTKYEKAIAKIDDLNDLQTAYDTLKTDYDRRYFLHALPGYFADLKIKAVPDWVEKAVLEGIGSRKPLYIREASNTAGALGISCSRELMDLYPTVRATYGNHEDMLKSTIIAALIRMENSSKKQFYYDILTKDDVPLMSASFSALLDALFKEPDPMYAQNLMEKSSVLGIQIAQIEADTDKEKKYQLPRLREVKEKIDRVRSRITTGGVK
jgi:hypothetical protein